MGRVLLLAILCSPAWACSCHGYPSVKEAWLDSPLVFAGVVERTDPKVTSALQMSGEQAAWVRVKEAFKGVEENQVVELRGQFSSCFGGFHEGSELLYYVHAGAKQGTWVAPACHRSRPLGDAEEDLRFLRGLPASAQGNMVSGTIELWEDDPVKRFDVSRAMAGVRVHAVGAVRSFETVTNSRGLYEFRDLPPGGYTIRVDYPKGTKLRFPIPFGKITKAGRQRGSQPGGEAQLEVTAESSNGFHFNLAPDTRISGRVLDPEGRPMKGVCISAESLEEKSERGSRISDCTESDGSYSLEMLPAGSYRIVANRGGVISAEAPFGRLYHPGTPTVEKARILAVSAGQHLDGIDIRVSELARRIELRGRLIFSNGVTLARQSLDFLGNDGKYRQNGHTDDDGSFVVQILAGQSGTLTGKISIWRDLAGPCPQFGAKFHPNGHFALLNSTPYPVAGDVSLSGIEVVFPFPSCDEWPKKEGKREPF